MSFLLSKYKNPSQVNVFHLIGGRPPFANALCLDLWSRPHHPGPEVNGLPPAMCCCKAQTIELKPQQLQKRGNSLSDRQRAKNKKLHSSTWNSPRQLQWIELLHLREDRHERTSDDKKLRRTACRTLGLTPFYTSLIVVMEGAIPSASWARTGGGVPGTCDCLPQNFVLPSKSKPWSLRAAFFSNWPSRRLRSAREIARSPLSLYMRDGGLEGHPHVLAHLLRSVLTSKYSECVHIVQALQHPSVQCHHCFE